MLPEAKALQLIAIYYYVCEQYETKLQYLVQRFSNNNKPVFTDPEIMTIYLFAMRCEQRFRIRHLYDFADAYLRSWFPQLPTYQAFNNRLNRLSEAFKALASDLLLSAQPANNQAVYSLMDSLPIITCSGKRRAKVARELVDKGYCSTKSMYYHGLKLHLLGFGQVGKMPLPEQIIITEASENDLNVLRDEWSQVAGRTFYGDKIYKDKELHAYMEKQHDSVVHTPVKAVKNMGDAERQRNRAADDLFSRAVSRLRQPVESLFNWLIEKTDIQRASKTRSTKGLVLHVFARIAAAFILLAS